MRPDSITLAIFEKYTPEELATTATAMAQAQSDMETAESEKKVSDGVFNERIKQHAAKVSELAQKYNKGGETAQIGCTIRYDIPEIGKKSYVRMDREETIEIHDMTLEEKQETLQFPLTAAKTEEPKPEEPMPTEPTHEPAPAPPAPVEITFKDFQGMAVHIAKLAPEEHAKAITDMTQTIAPQLLAQKSVIGPDGQVEAIDSQETAERLTKAWLVLAVLTEVTPVTPVTEEVTRLCPYPGCILFAEHDGDHDFPPADAAKPTDTAATPEHQQEQKPKRKKRGFAPPLDTPTDGGPAVQP